MKKKITFILALAAVLCACVSFAACNIFGGNNKRKETAPADIILGEITDSSIEVKDCVFDDEYSHFPQFSLDGKSWTERLSIGEGLGSYIFEGLEPNTEYTIYAREGSRDESHDPSDAITKTATTLRTAASGVPEGVDYTQQYGKITLVNFTDEMEASFDGGETYGGGEYTYTAKGEYTVLVRYKQTDKAYASESVELKLEYSDFSGGLGTEQKPYLVSNYAELCKINLYHVTCYKLINDITFPSEAVGSITLNGNLDGDGKKLISPKIDTALNANGETSLFYTNGSTRCSIKNLTVENILYTSNKRASSAKEGLLIDYAREVTNCRVTGEMIINEVSGSNGSDRARFGGIAGWASYLGRITDCTADVKFTVANGAAVEKDYYFGGIAGDISSTKITGCKANVSFDMTAENNYSVIAGGVVGRAGTGVDIVACSAQVQFSAFGGNKVELGGIAGKVNGSADIVNCFAGGAIIASGNGEYRDGYGKPAKLAVGGVIGGIEGVNSAGAQSCVSSVNLEVDGTGVDVHCAGIIAEIYTNEEKQVANCLYAGSITVNADSERQTCMGAILGCAEPLYTVENCYYTPQAPVTDWTADGGAEVNNACLSADWQREHLKLDETLWTIADGKLPGLK